MNHWPCTTAGFLPFLLPELLQRRYRVLEEEGTEAGSVRGPP